MNPNLSRSVQIYTERDAHIQRLRDQIELLKTIKVSLDGHLLALTDLPGVLHIDTLHTHIQQATLEIQGALPRQGKSQETEPLVVIEAASTGAQSQAEPGQELLFSEQKLLKKLTAQVGALSRSEKALFTWLIEHDGAKISVQHLADAVGMDRGVTWTRQTRKLVKLPFVARWGTNQFWYQAVFADYARRYFASVSDAHGLAQLLLKAAQ